MTLILRKESFRESPISWPLNLFLRAPVTVSDGNLTRISESQKFFGLRKRISYLEN